MTSPVISHGCCDSVQSTTRPESVCLGLGYVAAGATGQATPLLPNVTGTLMIEDTHVRQDAGLRLCDGGQPS